MPTYAEDYQKIEEARKRAGALGQRALKLQAGAETFSDRVMKDVRAARAARGTSMLAQDIGTTTGQLATGGPEMRARMAMVNPLQVDVMTARQRAGTLGTLATQALAQEGVTGTIEDIIGGGVSQLKAAALMKKAEADKATEEANTLFEQVQLREAQAQREFDEWAKRQQIAQGWARIGEEGEGFQDWLTKQIVSKRIGAMTEEVPSSVKTKASNLKSLIDEMKRLKEGIGERGFLGSLMGGPTGPLAGLLGAVGKEGQIRADISNFEGKVKHDVYGAALTESEKKEYGKWGPSPKRQEITNRKRLISKITEKENELKNLLRGQGLSEDSIDAFMTTGRFPESSMQDIFGELQSLFGGTEWQDTGNTVER